MKNEGRLSIQPAYRDFSWFPGGKMSFSLAAKTPLGRVSTKPWMALLSTRKTPLNTSCILQHSGKGAT